MQTEARLDLSPPTSQRAAVLATLPRHPLPPIVLVIAASAALWAMLLILIPPSAQEFPLVDDWAYARGVFTFARGGGIHYPKWGSMPQLGQWVWACPFLWLLHPSHVALRLSTIVLSGLGLWSFADLLRRGGLSAERSALGAACLAFTPLFFLLQGTFMTDVPALSLSLLALTCYARAAEIGKSAWLLPGCAVALLAVATRQNTLAVPLVGAILIGRNPGLRLRPLWIASVLVPVGAGLVVHRWYSGRLDTMPAEPGVPAPDVVLLLPYLIVHLCGLVALPVLLLDPRPASWKRFLFALVGMVAFAFYWARKGPNYLVYAGLFPYSDGMLTPWGAYSGALVFGQRPLLLGHNLRLSLTILGCVSGALLLDRGWDKVRSGQSFHPLVWFTALQVPFVIVAPEVWDRYLLTLFPGAIWLALPSGHVPRWGRPPALATLVLIGAVSFALMHDWLAWNSARWSLGRRAVARGLHPDDIEGGFEWDGWYAPDERPQIKSMTQLFRHAQQPMAPRGLCILTTRNWFPNVSGRYALAFSNPGRYRVLDEEPYEQWLLPGRRRFLLLEFTPSSKKAITEDEKGTSRKT